MFITSSWDIVYYIITKRGDHKNEYFIYQQHDLCNLHNSHSCGCKLDISREELINNIEQSIELYKLCSTLYIISNNRIQRFGTNAKIKSIKE